VESLSVGLEKGEPGVRAPLLMLVICRAVGCRFPQH
jgi:hypothetical protein